MRHRPTQEEICGENMIAGPWSLILEKEKHNFRMLHGTVQRARGSQIIYIMFIQASSSVSLLNTDVKKGKGRVSSESKKY